MSSILERLSGTNSTVVASEYRDKVLKKFHNPEHILDSYESDHKDGGINPLETVNLSNHVVVPKSLPNAITRHFVFRIEDTLSQLAKEPRKLLCAPGNLDIFKTHTRYSPSAIQRTPDLQGDLNQVAILGAEIVSYDSNIPTPLNINFVDGNEQRDFPAFRGNYRDVVTGKRIHYSIPPLGKCGNVNKAINTTSPFIHCTYLSKYKGLVSGEALRTTGIKRHDDIGTSMVSVEHPVVSIIQSNQDLFKLDENQMKEDRSPPNPRTGETIPIYYIDNEIVDACIDLLEEDLRNNLPLFNISGLRMKISRPGLNDNKFDSKTGLVFEPDIAKLENIKNPSDDTPKYNQRNVPRYVEVVVAVSYAFL